MKQSKQAHAAKQPRALDAQALAPVAGGQGQAQPWRQAPTAPASGSPQPW